MPTRHSSSNAGHCMTKPSKATAMMAISQSLTRRISTVLSMRSASCPAVADSSTKGVMNSAPITKPATGAGNHATCN